MPFSAQELDNIANAALDYYVKGKPLSQTIQDKPLLKALKGVQKTFPGGRGEIKANVKNDYTTTFAGYSHDDQVSYGNPANIKQFTYPWYELHAGLSLTLTELKKDGLSISDSTAGDATESHSVRELTAISDIMQDKLEDMDEGMARSMNEIFWRDGTQSTKVPPGILYFLPDDNTTGVVGGIDRAANTWWRHRTALSLDASTPANQVVTLRLRKELRQIRRYGGKPSLWLAGSAFIEALEAEVFSKGYYTQDGFTKGKTDISSPAITMRDLGDIMYDPTLDDLGRSKYAYGIDTRHLYPYVMDGEDMKVHKPARPPEKYVLYRGVTWTGAIIGRKMNSHLVASIA